MGPSGSSDTGWAAREGSEQLVRRSRKAGFTALVVTVDGPVRGNHERSLKLGVNFPRGFGMTTVRRYGPQSVLHPRWLVDFARDGFHLELALAQGLGSSDAPMTSDEALNQGALNPITWDDFGWLREAFGGPLLVKGLVTKQDARRAVDAGASGVIVSNHGGRQLDGLASSLFALQEVAAEVGDEVEVLVDSGIRRGSDVAKALALGAKAVLVGRPWVYGLGAAGEPGVRKVLEILRQELERTLRLVGVGSVQDLDGSILRLGGDGLLPG